MTDSWWPPADRIPSPNLDDRPPDCAVDLLVIHNISLPPGEFGTGCVQAFFTNDLDYRQHPYFQTLVGVRVSAHCFIERNGRVIQFVPFNRRAWHAGVSCHLGRGNCNDFSIGIELEGTDQLAYTSAQYGRLADLTRYLMALYPGITAERIVGHSDIAPERKTDPGPAFDWAGYRESLAKG